MTKAVALLLFFFSTGSSDLSEKCGFCIPFNKVADAEFLPGGWNIRINDNDTDTIWLPYNSQETQDILICHKAGKWYTRKQGTEP